MSRSDEVLRAAIVMLAGALGGDRIESHPGRQSQSENSPPEKSSARTFTHHQRHGRVGLAMIVRNEEGVIGRCLDSVLPLIDTWTIVDTGSTDVTRDIVRQRLGHLPGQLHERQWRDFATNRNELLDLAGGTADYLLLLDADIEVQDRGFQPDQLTMDAHEVAVTGGIDYRMPYIVRSKAPWFYVGRTHEYLTADVPLTSDFLPTLEFHHHADGGSRGDKFERDRKLLEEDLRAQPENTRTVFYLAQTRQHLGDASGALAAYRRRLEMGGWEEEIFWCLYQCGRILESAGEWPYAAQAYGWAWEYRPTRIEPLLRLAQGYRSRSMFRLGWIVAQQGSALRRPDDRLFVEGWMYDWGIEFERSVLAWWMGERALARELTEKLLARTDIAPEYRDALSVNHEFYVQQSRADR